MKLNLVCLPQGERGPPGVNGTQGFQGCPGQRGVKVSSSEKSPKQDLAPTFGHSIPIDTLPVPARGSMQTIVTESISSI